MKKNFISWSQCESRSPVLSHWWRVIWLFLCVLQSPALWIVPSWQHTTLPSDIRWKIRCTRSIMTTLRSAVPEETPLILQACVVNVWMVRCHCLLVIESFHSTGMRLWGVWGQPFTATQWWACVWLWIQCLLLPCVFSLWTVDFTFIVPPSCIQPELACYSLPRPFTRLPFVSPSYVSSSKKSFQPVFVPATK